MSGVAAAVAVDGLLLAAARVFPRRPRRGPQAGFRVGPLWTWCPAEERQTPHLVDAGGRRCLSCKTSTSTTEETTHG
ncbi:hypothetical protein OV450_1461 [Actinobacteria bacterium OV450]|nr:hypothetical protein OV450_1461 [Actinobacteria bacterium OV450]